MRSLAIALSALLVVALTLVVPPAEACGAGGWSRSTLLHQEIVGVGATGVGAYASEKRWQDDADGPCDGASYAERCGGSETLPGSTVAGPATVGPVVVPEVRVLGIVVVERTSANATVPAVATPDLVAPAAATDDACWTTPYDAGVYAGSRVVGTDRDPFWLYDEARARCHNVLGSTCSRLPWL